MQKWFVIGHYIGRKDFVSYIQNGFGATLYDNCSRCRHYVPTYYCAIEKKKQISRDYYGAFGSPSLSVVVDK
jgi:hypothetical protein